MRRGFGIAATADLEQAQTIAAAVESLGYTSVWSNDLPRADGLATAAAMAEAAPSLPVGVGVIPIDRRDPVEIATAIEKLQIPLDRLLLGIGSGTSARPVGSVAAAAAELRELLGPDLRLGISAMGPQMCRLGGRIADFVMLNWMTPERIEWASRHIESGAGPGFDPPDKFCYIRVATGENALERLAAEAAKYGRYPAYQRHFQAMAVPLEAVGVAAASRDVPSELAAYDRVLDEGVVRALPPAQSVESLLSAANEAAPAS